MASPSLATAKAIDPDDISHGMRTNAVQFALQASIVASVGLFLGADRTVVPLLAKEEFGVTGTAVVAAILVAFGVVKGSLNLAGGLLAGRGRRQLALVGWAIGAPVPFMIMGATQWWHVIAANVLLGAQQGLAWSMSVNAKIDLATTAQRALAVGIDETAGYSGIAVGSLIAALIADSEGLRPYPFVFMAAVWLLGMILVGISAETLPWVHAAHVADGGDVESDKAVEMTMTPVASGNGDDDTTDKRVVVVPSAAPVRLMIPVFGLLCWAGHVVKWIDAGMWLVLPLYIKSQDGSTADVGTVSFVFAICWGLSQLPGGALAGHLGRRPVTVTGFIVCGAAVSALPLTDSFGWWIGTAATAGIGMGLLYPNLTTWTADLLPPLARARGIGWYRMYRDMGLAVGALVLAGLVELDGYRMAFGVVGLLNVVTGIALMLV